MKLSTHLTIRLTGLFLIIFLIWSVIYFFMQMHEIYDDLDEGLTNLKQEFILQANNDPAFVEAMEKYNPINMIVKEISFNEAIVIKEKHSTTKVYFETEKEFEEVRILSTAFKCQGNEKYYSIKLFTSTVETEDLMENMLLLLVALWLTLGLLLFWVGRRIIEKSSRPLQQLFDKLHAFSLNNTKMIDFPKTNISEFQTLNHAVEALLEENIEAYKEQKTFIENASHELQTPLTAIVSRVELMMNSKNTTEEQMVELSSILTNLNRMKRLNSSLLLLSKIRNKQFISNSPIDIQTIVSDVCQNYEDIITHKELTLEVDIQDSPTLEMNFDLAYIMISNLVKNAINYNIPHGSILIVLTQDSITFSNDGKPIADNIDIFERYNSSHSSSTATGLGLAIVTSIVTLYKFKINYSYNKRHTITIKFK